jgi:hypothetical protein
MAEIKGNFRYLPVPPRYPRNTVADLYEEKYKVISI